MESQPPRRRDSSPHVIAIRILGPLTIARDGVEIVLPASRKVRALLAYLTLSSHSIMRSQLCELLWDVPSDPRGELRWCLTKIRGVLDDPERHRVETHGDSVRLDLSDCSVDAFEIARAACNREPLAPEELDRLVRSVAGDVLEGSTVEGHPAFGGWLAAQRRRFRSYRAALLERLVVASDDDARLGYLDAWLEFAPFDRRVHEFVFDALARHAQIRDGDEHLAATIRRFEAEGLDGTPLREAWRAARLRVLAPARPMLAVDGNVHETVAVARRRASIVVMPFADWSERPGSRGGVADALAHDVIARLAKLRSLFVIAQGTVFALHERAIGADEAARMLDADYIASGSIRRGERLTVTVQLAETRSARILWAETFDRPLDDAFAVLDEIGNSIVASIANEIESSERDRAVLKPPDSLDAWEAHHRGLWHAYRFNAVDNERAQHFFTMAVRLDPTFARAHAGLSFTHFQNAFQGWSERGPEIARALEAAERSVEADDRDPAAHLAIGRALWLHGRHVESVVELERAIDFSPNFALGHYTLGFVQSQDGDPEAAIASSDRSRALSPFDPLLFGMLGTRSMALVRLGRFDEAADWGVKAAARPNAHAHILAIAAFSLALAGRLDAGQAYLASIHTTRPQYTVDDFLTAMQFSPEGAALYRDGARRLRMP